MSNTGLRIHGGRTSYRGERVGRDRSSAESTALSGCPLATRSRAFCWSDLTLQSLEQGPRRLLAQEPLQLTGLMLGGALMSARDERDRVAGQIHLLRIRTSFGFVQR